MYGIHQLYLNEGDATGRGSSSTVSQITAIKLNATNQSGPTSSYYSSRVDKVRGAKIIYFSSLREVRTVFNFVTKLVRMCVRLQTLSTTHRMMSVRKKKIQKSNPLIRFMAKTMVNDLSY